MNHTQHHGQYSVWHEALLLALQRLGGRAELHALCPAVVAARQELSQPYYSIVRETAEQSPYVVPMEDGSWQLVLPRREDITMS
jgi:hypothetical protein